MAQFNRSVLVALAATAHFLTMASIGNAKSLNLESLKPRPAAARSQSAGSVDLLKVSEPPVEKSDWKEVECEVSVDESTGLSKYPSLDGERGCKKFHRSL